MSLRAKLQLEEGQRVALINPPSGFEVDAPRGEAAEDAVLQKAAGRPPGEAGQPR